MGNKTRIRWHAEPDADVYDGALSYLSLIFEPARARDCVKRLRRARTEAFWAQDILRAAQMRPLAVNDGQVERNMEKIIAGKKLAPLLLVRDGGRVIIADGYHRLCAVHAVDVEARVPCCIV
jgi:hypothetical protein